MTGQFRSRPVQTDATQWAIDKGPRGVPSVSHSARYGLRGRWRVSGDGPPPSRGAFSPHIPSTPPPCSPFRTKVAPSVRRPPSATPAVRQGQRKRKPTSTTAFSDEPPMRPDGCLYYFNYWPSGRLSPRDVGIGLAGGSGGRRTRTLGHPGPPGPPPPPPRRSGSVSFHEGCSSEWTCLLRLSVTDGVPRGADTSTDGFTWAGQQ